MQDGSRIETKTQHLTVGVDKAVVWVTHMGLSLEKERYLRTKLCGTPTLRNKREEEE